MAFGDNSTLITSANVIDVVADGGSADVYVGTAAADTFVFADGDLGDDTLLGFSTNDSIITHKKIYDGNNDGYIAFGPNGVLDVDRTSSKKPGNDQIQVVGDNGDILLLRYLGTKDNVDFAYADARTYDQLMGSKAKGDLPPGVNFVADSSITQNTKLESKVGDETFNFASGSVAVLFDNALGLNLGADTINGFGGDDLLIFTSKIYDHNGDNKITFSSNNVMDIAGADGPLATDPAGGPGGQLGLDSPFATTIQYLGEKTIGGVTYYYYGSDGTSLTPDGVSIA